MKCFNYRKDGYFKTTHFILSYEMLILFAKVLHMEINKILFLLVYHSKYFVQENT